MKPIKPLHVLMILAFIVFMLVLNQRFAIGDPTYPLPPLSSQASASNYPEKVKESLKSVISLSVNISFKNSRSPLSEGYLMKSGGTGFMIYPGVFVSAGHILTSSLDRMMGNYLMTFDKYGVPSSDFFTYSMLGITDAGNKSSDIPLNLVGMGDPNKFHDFMVLKTTAYPAELKPLGVDNRIMSVDEAVYNSGYVLSHIVLDRKTNIPVLFDIIRKSFIGRVDAVITNFPINEVTGFPALYRLEIKLEPGYSGGPIFNSEGKVVAITILRSDNFSYAIPIREISFFVDKLEGGGIVSKK